SCRRKAASRYGKNRLFRHSRRNSEPGRSSRHQTPLHPDGAVTCFRIFLILLASSGSEGTTAMTAVSTSHRTRIILPALVLILGAFWAGARFAPRQPTSVEAVPRGAGDAKSVEQRDRALTDDESINVRIYRQASPAVANILTKATEYDFFMDPVPVEGAGSGFVIDARGYIL